MPLVDDGYTNRTVHLWGKNSHNGSSLALRSIHPKQAQAAVRTTHIKAAARRALPQVWILFDSGESRVRNSAWIQHAGVTRLVPSVYQRAGTRCGIPAYVPLTFRLTKFVSHNLTPKDARPAECCKHEWFVSSKEDPCRLCRVSCAASCA